MIVASTTLLMRVAHLIGRNEIALQQKGSPRNGMWNQLLLAVFERSAIYSRYRSMLFDVAKVGQETAWCPGTLDGNTI